MNEVVSEWSAYWLRKFVWFHLGNLVLSTAGFLFRISHFISHLTPRLASNSARLQTTSGISVIGLLQSLMIQS